MIVRSDVNYTDAPNWAVALHGKFFGLVAKDSHDLAYESKSYKYIFFFMSIHREINRDPMLPLSLSVSWPVCHLLV